MAANQQILKEYLLSLGFKIDETSHRRFDDTLGKTDASAMGLAKKLFGVGAAAQAMVAVFAKQMENLYYASKRTGATVDNIQALEFGAKQIGIQGGTMRAALEGMARALRSNPGLQGLLEGLGVRVEGRDKSDVMTDLVKQLKGMPFYVAQQYASMFGIDPDTLFMLQEGVEELEKARNLRKQMAKDAGLDLEAAALAGKNYANALGQVYERLGILKDIVSVAILPAFQESTTWILKALDALNKYLGTWSKVSASAQLGQAADKTKAATGSYWDFTKKFWGAVTGSGAQATPAQGSKANEPLGIRNNNPGNLRSWPGAGSSGGFAQFGSADDGISAMAQNLLTYFRKYGLDTISSIIKRWAPSNENNTGAYVGAVSKMMGLSADQKLNLNDPAILASLMTAITTQENGKNPYDPSAFANAASTRIGGGATLYQTTTINLATPDPSAAGRLVSGEQDRVNSSIVRNLSGAE